MHKLPISKTALVLGVMFMAAAGVIALMWRSTAHEGVPIATANVGGTARETFDAESRLVVVHAQWCGHCKTLLKEGGEWDKAKAKLAGVQVEEIDEATSPDLVQKLNVTSFPDIRVLKGDETVAKYEGDRESDRLVEFALQHIR